jgi:hypothetical protein
VGISGQKETAMADPLAPERFALLAERAGLDPAKIGAERFEELRQGTRFLERFRSSVRRSRDGTARDRAAEPAHIFVHARPAVPAASAPNLSPLAGEGPPLPDPAATVPSAPPPVAGEGSIGA